MKGHIGDFTSDFYIEKRKNKEKKSKERETQYTAHSSRMFSAVISDKCFFRDIYLCRREKHLMKYMLLYRKLTGEIIHREENTVYIKMSQHTDTSTP